MSSIYINIEMSNTCAGSKASVCAHFAHDTSILPRVIFVAGRDGCRDFVTIAAVSLEQRAEVEMYLDVEQARELAQRLLEAIKPAVE